jgi:uncharacterized membrane protein
MEARDALAKWERDGLISGELAATLRTTLEADEKQQRTNRLIVLLVGVGAILIGGGLLLFISSHWDSQSPIRRVGLLVLVYALVVAAAAIADRQRLETTGRGLWFLSSITVGVNIFLLAQIFNLPLNFWLGTLLWMIAALVMGWASPSVVQGWLVVVLGVLTLGWISVPSSEFFDQGAFLWEPGGIRPLLPLLGLALAAGSSLVTGSDFEFLQQPSRAVGVLMIAAPITISTFHPYVFAGVWEMDTRWFHLICVVGCVAVIGLSAWRTRSPLLMWALPVLGALMVVMLIQVEFDQDTPSSLNDFEGSSWLAEPVASSEWMLALYTAVIFALALAVIEAGQRFRVTALVNAGVVVVAVLIMSIYIGRVAGELPTSIAVLLGGVLLVAGAVFLERKRRDLVAEVVS